MKVILCVPDEGYSERTWWRLFWAYLMKVILSVPDEGYSERTWWRLFWAYLMKVILSVPDEGYSERTWWRLFWAYLMKVILSVPDEDCKSSCVLVGFRLYSCSGIAKYLQDTWYTNCTHPHFLSTLKDLFILYNNNNNNVDIKCSAHDTFLE
jgi:hypothetical protein